MEIVNKGYEITTWWKEMLQQSYILLSCTRRFIPYAHCSLIDRFEIGNQKKSWANCKIVRIWFLPIFIKPQSISPLHFQLPLPTWRNLFSASGIFCGGKYEEEAVLGYPDQWKVPANLSLFLKSEKIPTLLYVGKGLSTGPSVIFDLFPWAPGLCFT